MFKLDDIVYVVTKKLITERKECNVCCGAGTLYNTRNETVTCQHCLGRGVLNYNTRNIVWSVEKTKISYDTVLGIIGAMDKKGKLSYYTKLGYFEAGEIFTSEKKAKEYLTEMFSDTF